MMHSPCRLIAACLLVPLCCLTGCQKSQSAPATASVAAPAAPLETPLTKVEKRPWRTVIRAQGGLVADESTVIGAKVAGRVGVIDVDLGDLVKQGDVLARLDEEDLRLQVRQAEAQLAQARAAVGLTGERADDDVDRENSPVVRQERAVLDEAKTNYARLKLLEERNAVTQADLETSAAAVAVAEARYASSLNAVEEKLAMIQLRRAELLLIQEMLKEATIRAPFDGLVQERQAAPGAYLRVGDPVATLVRIDPLRFRGTIPERHALTLRTGQVVYVHLDGLPEPLTAQVSRISPTLEEFSRALTFEADVPNHEGRLRSGLFAEAEIVVDSQSEALTVPVSSIVEFAGVEKVWQVREGQAQEVPVRTGRRIGGLVEILAGLSAGDTVLQRATEGRAGPVTASSGNENMGG